MTKAKTKMVWMQEWEESERGWGTRPDGFTLHHKEEDIDLFLTAMRDREAEMFGPDYVPNEYSRPYGRPFAVKVPAKFVPPKKSIGKWLALNYGEFKLETSSNDYKILVEVLDDDVSVLPRRRA